MPCWRDACCAVLALLCSSGLVLPFGSLVFHYLPLLPGGTTRRWRATRLAAYIPPPRLYVRLYGCYLLSGFAQRVYRHLSSANTGFLQHIYCWFAAFWFNGFASNVAWRAPPRTAQALRTHRRRCGANAWGRAPAAFCDAWFHKATAGGRRRHRGWKDIHRAACLRTWCCHHSAWRAVIYPGGV